MTVTHKPLEMISGSALSAGGAEASAGEADISGGIDITGVLPGVTSVLGDAEIGGLSVTGVSEGGADGDGLVTGVSVSSGGSTRFCSDTELRSPVSELGRALALSIPIPEVSSRASTSSAAVLLCQLI